jgi:hypothetical protein
MKALYVQVGKYQLEEFRGQIREHRAQLERGWREEKSAPRQQIINVVLLLVPLSFILDFRSADPGYSNSDSPAGFSSFYTG